MKDIKNAYLKEKVGIKCVYFFYFGWVKTPFLKLSMFFFLNGSEFCQKLICTHFQGASLANKCIVWHQTLIKDPTSQVSHQGPVWPHPSGSFHQFFLTLHWEELSVNQPMCSLFIAMPVLLLEGTITTFVLTISLLHHYKIICQVFHRETQLQLFTLYFVYNRNMQQLGHS